MTSTAAAFPPLDSAPATPVDERIERLSRLSLKRVMEPDESLPGTVGPGQVLPDELLSIAGVELDLALDATQRATLSREEVASIVQAGIRFEAVLLAGFGLEILRRDDLTDPRVTYILHELGEETRHSRLFIRLLGQLEPRAVNPLRNRVVRTVERTVLPRLLFMPAFFCTLVLAGEEIPDLFQKLASEHPDTDPFVREVSRYHRQEEARHLGFARMLLPELWAGASKRERFMLRHAAPHMIGGMFDMMVHPGVYEAVGLPGWATWKKVTRSPRRVELKHQALRPILASLVETGAFAAGKVPRGWQRVCGVDRYGRPT